MPSTPRSRDDASNPATHGMIRIRKARQNNLAGVDVDLPRESLIAVTGVSGSGKSSLAFDTLYREGQRRFLETLSAYARQFLGGMEKPEVDSIEGLSPAIAVDQKSIQRGARSTVGTLTEIVDHLRVLYARAGRAHCPACKLPVQSRTREEIVQALLREHAGQAIHLLAPVVRDRKGSHEELLASLRKKGFVRARIDGEVVRLEDAPALERYKRHTIEVVVDRLRLEGDKPERLRESLQQALELGAGDIVVAGDKGDTVHSTSRTCPGCGADTPPLEPRLFSFNSPHGACDACEGLGERLQPSERALVADAAKSIREGALATTRASGGALVFPNVTFKFLESVAKEHGFDLDTPWRDLPARAKRIVLHGAGDERFEDSVQWSGAKYAGNATWKRRYVGVVPAIERGAEKGIHKKRAQRFLARKPCDACQGTRLNPAANAVLLGGVPWSEFARAPIGDLPKKLDALQLSDREARIARDLVKEVRRRVAFLLEVGLAYLTLERSAETLSGGEAQRIRLAAQLGAGLQGVLYVLDEPSIGLHSRDHEQLVGALRSLRDAGNTVVVVEHDEATLRSADWLVDVGPGAGRHGGHIVASGTPAEVAKGDGATARLLRGEIAMQKPATRRKGSGKQLVVEGARAFNLKGVDVAVPLGMLVAVTGVSGSGKSTLVNHILERAVRRKLGLEAPAPEEHDRVRGMEHVDDLVTIDATPIGRTPRSNPATYIGVFDHVRELYAQLPESKLRGWTRSRFSFNVAGGRCESCQGAGAKYVELQFLAPVTVPCEECGGKRFGADTLDARFKGKTISDVLAMPAEEAAELFSELPKIAAPLKLMGEIGLGYLALGQPSTTLSGGEAQRLKLVTELQKKPKGHTLYVLDEPTTGLHALDVARLVAALQRLVDLGHTVLVVEHELDLVSAADHVIDLGPEGGEDGGRLVVVGTPEAVEAHRGSHTGAALRAFHGRKRHASAARREARRLAPPDSISVRGARTHNLKGVDVSLPRGKFTVVTGPSGSGKSSLALDTIHVEGKRRFVESLSTYARQFLGTKDRPPVESIEGLGPSVAVEARGGGAQPRSTVATTTEIHDHLRVLWARAATRRCPEHGEELKPRDASSIAKAMLTAHSGTTAWLVAPLSGHGVEAPLDDSAWTARLDAARAAGWTRLIVDGVEARLDGELPALGQAQSVDLVLDRVKVESAARGRMVEAIEQSAVVAHGRCDLVVRGSDGRPAARGSWSLLGACTQCGFVVGETLEPRHFSFNTHVGACPACDGLGERARCTSAMLVDSPELSIEAGAVHGKISRWLVKGKGYYENLLRTVAREHGLYLSEPFESYDEAQKALLCHGVGAKRQYKVEIERETRNAQIEESFVASWPGLCGLVDQWHKKTEDPEWAAILEQVMERTTCPECEGEKLKPASRAATIGRMRLPEVLKCDVSAAREWIGALEDKRGLPEAVEPVVVEISSRLELLEKVGLGYLSLDRRTATLSGGEMRRVRLSASLGSQLTGVCYVLDEPTVGLHPADTAKLCDALVELKQRGNTVVAVEHDTSLMRRADWLVDMGPGSGIHGGQVVACGTPEEVARHKESGTAAALRGEIQLSRTRRDPMLARESVKLVGARGQNLQGVDFEFAFGELTGVCGPSGAGKSTLVLDTLVPALLGEKPAGRWKRLVGVPGGMVRTVLVDATPIGRTPASVPATYTGLMETLRELWARVPEARVRGLELPHFSFNNPRGRCPACEGKGATKVEMQFLADLWLPCEECEGKRFSKEVLDVRWRGKDLAEALELTVAEALEFFAHQPRAVQILETLRDTGLGYIRLGQASTTLSGGEAQRVKLSAELFRAQGAGRGVVVLDEPTTGLALSDVRHLVAVLDRLAAAGNAVVVVEHHVELLSTCDRLVELGPAGGAGGGRIVAAGTPAELAADPASITGPWLCAAPDAKKKSAARTKVKH